MENMLNKMDQIEQLRKAGFGVHVYEDRDFADFNNIRVLEYRKDITPECTIIYSEYHVAERPGDFELKEQSAELLIGEDSVALLPDISKLLDLLEKLLEIVIHKNIQL